MKNPTWARLEKALFGDAFSVFYELEMRKALLDSNRFPQLREKLESEIGPLEKRFAEVAPMYLTAQKYADRERQARAAKKAKETGADST